MTGTKSKTMQTAVLGVSGYAGAELARLLLHHPRLHGVAPVFFGRESESDASIALTDLHPQLADNNGSATLRVEPFRWAALRERGIDVVFLATPHEQSRAWVPDLLSHGVRVIDLSGAWRLQQSENRAVYKFEDADATVAAHDAAPGCLWNAGIASRGDSGRKDCRQSRLLFHGGHSGHGTHRAGWLGQSGARHYLRCEVGCLWRGQSAHGQDALYVCGG